MDQNVYRSAQVGDLDVLRRYDSQLLHVQSTPNKNTVLHVAAQFHDSADFVSGCLEMLSSATKQSMLVSTNSEGETALHIAARNGHSKVARALVECARAADREELENGGKIADEMMRATDENGDTALHEAVRYGHTKVVRLLVQEDPDFEHRLNDMSESPLYLAVERHSHENVDSILTTCKSPVSQGPCGRTALHAAVSHNCEECTRKLLKHKQELAKEVDEYGWTPLHYAARFNLVSIAAQLLETDSSAAYVAAPNDENKTALHVAAWKGKAEVMKELLKHCPDCWEMTTSKAQNVLHLSVKSEREKAVDFILSSSWAHNLINKKDAKGNTPLHLYANSDMMRAANLVQHPSADINAFNRLNLTPLDRIMQYRYYLKRKDSIKDEFRRNGGVKGYRNIVEKDRDSYRSKRDSRERKQLPKDLRKLGDTNLIVATLIATVTFAAGFTIPGGYEGSEGPGQGKAVLAERSAFKAFVLLDTIAVVSSITAVFLHFAASFYQDRVKIVNRYNSAILLITISAVAMAAAFVMGLYTVLAPPASGLAIAVCLIGFLCVPILLWIFHSLLKTNPQRETEAGASLEVLYSM